VACIARETRAALVIDNDAHAPDDLIDQRMRRTVGLGAGLSREEFDQIGQATLDVITKVKERLEKEEH
jgi:hypothetical protein